jgi:predicted RNase H-like HicB family nuclease
VKKVLRYPVIIEKAKRNYSAYCPDLPGCVATGKTVKETLENIRSAVEFHLEGLKREGLLIPKPRTNVEYIEVAVSA